ncbi:MAG: hypothetical protein WBY53_15205 [Acidobacteriaceae bacterium]
MIDVHPPHKPLNHWKDFWIHLGTITAGLLIAIGLEQSVEAMHRLHERHILQHELHDEAIRNERILIRDIQILHARSVFLASQRSNVDALHRGASAASLSQPEEPANEDPFMPSAGTWTSARDSSQLALLPREQASVYEELYAQRDFLQQNIVDIFRTADELDSFISNTEAAESSTQLDPTKLTAAEQEEYSRLLSTEITQLNSTVSELEFYEAENAAIVEGVTDVDELHQRVLSREKSASPSTINRDDSPRKNP